MQHATVIDIALSPGTDHGRESFMPRQSRPPKTEEYRNMIRHILGKLDKRKRPVPALMRLGRPTTHQVDNEDVVDLMLQLRASLILCHQMGFASQILFPGRSPYGSPASSRSNSPSPSPVNTEGVAASVIPTKKDSRSAFDRILTVLEELALNDCRHKVTNPKPSRPPFTLQSVIIDVGALLIEFCDDSTSLYSIGSTLLPAFDAFHDGVMLGKLLGLYIDALLPKLMKCKDEPRRGRSLGKRHTTETATTPTYTRHVENMTPTINIQSPDPETNQRISHLTIDTAFASPSTSIRSPGGPRSPSQSHASQQPADIYHAYSLFTPLLFFMIQYLDPYLAGIGSHTEMNSSVPIPKHANSIYNFHRGLKYMIQQKPDIYLDILDVVSRSAPEVRFRACQVLFHYYFIALGHIIVAEPLPRLGSYEEISALHKDHDKNDAETTDRRVQPSTDPSFFGTVIGNSATLTGIHKKYRAGHHPTASPTRHTELNTSPSEIEESDDTHIWYPHMFTVHGDEQEEFQLDHSQRLRMPAAGFDAAVRGDLNGAHCKECYKMIKGFGLRCYQCKCSVHYSCFNYRIANNELDVMLYVKKGDVQKVVSPQFCHVPLQSRFDAVTQSEAWNVTVGHPKVDILGHQFHLVNLYTLMLCACCRLPLWGISQQGYRCSTCNRFVHPNCLAQAEADSGFNHPHFSIQDCRPYQPLQENDTQITQQDLCNSLASFYYGLLPSSAEELEDRSFEEVGTMLSVMRLQENILHYGIASGSLLVSQEFDDPLRHSDTDLPFSQVCPLLNESAKICKKHLDSGKCRASSFLSDFYNHRHHNLEEYVLSKEEYLSHLAAMMKTLATADTGTISGTLIQSSVASKRRSVGDARGFLQVTPNPFQDHWDNDVTSDEDEAPLEMMGSDTMLTWITDNLRFKSQKAAEILLQHMHSLGLFERYDASPVLFAADSMAADITRQNAPSVSKPAADTIQCIFPVPFAIDCSPNVESLINAIEACLDDIDIAINECGMLLLVRRCWPDPFMSRYTIERLVHAILCWLFQEDEKLTILLEEFTNSKPQLPGVRQTKWTQTAQTALLARMKGPHSSPERQRQSGMLHTTAGMSSGAGSVYVTARSALRERYLVQWMSIIHDLDKEAYAAMLFDVIERIVEGKREEGSIPEWIDKADQRRSTLLKYEELMGCILKLKTCGLTFTGFESVLERWMNSAYHDFDAQDLLKTNEPAELRSLAKLCSARGTTSKAFVARSSTHEAAHPFDIITKMFTVENNESMERGIRWLALVMHAGTGAPPQSLAKIARLLVASGATIHITAEFIKLLWFQAINVLHAPIPHAVIIDIVGYLNETALPSLQSKNESQDLSLQRLESAQAFIKYSAALTCVAYECPISSIAGLDLIPFPGDHLAHTAQQKAPLLQVDGDTPIIRCMLLYLQYDQLNVRADIVKMMYALVHWGGINNKTEFIVQCIPSLVSAFWELLTSTYDDVSDINMGLLMKLLSTDARFFHICVQKVFEDDNWEVRYQGLDNLYGLFTKMDAAFQTKWLSMLPCLGPVFSYFVSCLWDSEENVRSKAYSLLRCFGTLHLQSAFRCWEAYLPVASKQEKAKLIHLMIRLNAFLPDWQVLQWESLLGTLEMEDSDRPDNPSVDILEQYVRQGNGATASNKDQLIEARASSSAEAENIKVLMLRLGLQMLSHNSPVDSTQISRLKYILVQRMGFAECQRYHTAGNWVVTFGNMRLDPTDASQHAVMVSCVAGLKKVVDSFSPLQAEAVASMAPDDLSHNKMKLAENSSPGTHFIDVVLKMFNSGVDLTQLNHMMLKLWLEAILIVVYKHNILDREYENSIVHSMKQIIELLTKEISEENKLLILEILRCLLSRSDHLTAMVLSRQIMALGKLMTKLGNKVSEPVFLKARQFLKSAFLRFAAAGLFVLMFKNQTVSDANNRDVDLFFVLSAVIDPEDVVPDEDFGEVVYLRDQPVRDVLDKLLKQHMERHSFSTVLNNMSRYIERVHSHPYPPALLNDYATFLNALLKYTSDWRKTDWDINPVFTMSAILIKEHPYHFQTILPAVQAMFRHGLQKCTVQLESIVKLLSAESAIALLSGSRPENGFTETIVEEVKVGLSSASKTHGDTLLTLLQLILWDASEDHQEWLLSIETTILGKIIQGRQRVRYFQKHLVTLLEPLVLFLRTASCNQQFTTRDFKTYNTASRVLVRLCKQDPNGLGAVLKMQKLDETRRCLRFLNWFLLGLLKDDADQLLQAMSGFESVMTDLLVQTLNSVQINFNNPDPNFSYSPSGEATLLCFLILKSWVLLSQRVAYLNTQDSGLSPSSTRLSFWLSVWPALRRILNSIEPSTLYMPNSIGLSVWTMFLSLLQFLFSCRSEAVLTNAHEWNLCLEDMLAQISAVETDMTLESHGSDELISLLDFKARATKLQRMFLNPTIEVPAATLIDHLYLELRDIMRLQAESISFHGNTRTLMMMNGNFYGAV